MPDGYRGDECKVFYSATVIDSLESGGGVNKPSLATWVEITKARASVQADNSGEADTTTRGSPTKTGRRGKPDPRPSLTLLSNRNDTVEQLLIGHATAEPPTEIAMFFCNGASGTSGNEGWVGNWHVRMSSVDQPAEGEATTTFDLIPSSFVEHYEVA